MPSPEKTGLNFNVSTGTLQKLWPLFLAAVFGMTSGGGASTWWDVTGARAYKENVSEQVAASAAKDARIVALEAQNAQLLKLLDGATLRVIE